MHGVRPLHPELPYSLARWPRCQSSSCSTAATSGAVVDDAAVIVAAGLSRRRRRPDRAAVRRAPSRSLGRPIVDRAFFFALSSSCCGRLQDTAARHRHSDHLPRPHDAAARAAGLALHERPDRRVACGGEPPTSFSSSGCCRSSSTCACSPRSSTPSASRLLHGLGIPLSPPRPAVFATRRATLRGSTARGTFSRSSSAAG